VTAGPFILEIDDGDGAGPSLRVLTPASVLVVLGKDDLEEKLDAFSDPIRNGVVRNAPRDRRWYVEKILPALRHYCDKYEVEQPGWLVGNEHWIGMDEADQERLFGPGELRLREFMPANCADIAVVRDDPEEGEEQ
jgi:hypothetical protein